MGAFKRKKMVVTLVIVLCFTFRLADGIIIHSLHSYDSFQKIWMPRQQVQSHNYYHQYPERRHNKHSRKREKN